jgi:hypothetical protein
MLSSYFSFMFNISITISLCLLCSFCYFITLLIDSSLCYLIIITFHLLFDNFIIFIYLFHYIMYCVYSLSSIVIVFCFIVLCILLNDSIVIKSHFQNNFAITLCLLFNASITITKNFIYLFHPFCLLCLLFTLCLLCTFWKLSFHALLFILFIMFLLAEHNRSSWCFKHKQYVFYFCLFCL